eukprot:Em0002g1101a
MPYSRFQNDVLYLNFYEDSSCNTQCCYPGGDSPVLDSSLDEPLCLLVSNLNEPPKIVASQMCRTRYPRFRMITMPLGGHDMEPGPSVSYDAGDPYGPIDRL